MTAEKRSEHWKEWLETHPNLPTRILDDLKAAEKRAKDAERERDERYTTAATTLIKRLDEDAARWHETAQALAELAREAYGWLYSDHAQCTDSCSAKSLCKDITAALARFHEQEGRVPSSQDLA